MRRWWIRIIVIVIPLLVLLVGPWPVDDSPFSSQKYYLETVKRIDQLTIEKQRGPLQVGYAQTDITPPLNIPLAGYSAREPKANIGIRDQLFAKAITLNNGIHQYTIINAEILLPLPELVSLVLKKTGLRRHDIYFAVSHTHSGPGAYGSEFIERIALGEFSETYLEQLAQQLADTIVQSRNTLIDAILDYHYFLLPEKFAATFIRNQLNERQGGHRGLHIMQIRRANSLKPFVTHITFSAHPTFLGRENRLVSGDYPSVLIRQLENTWQSPVLFSAGAVGAMAPVGLEEVSGLAEDKWIPQMEDMATRLASYITDMMKNPEPPVPNARLQLHRHWRAREILLDSHILNVDLPRATWRVSENLSLSPWLVRYLVHSEQSTIHAFRLGPIIMLGMPSDYSGELAIALENANYASAAYPWLTSFNGEYIGYLMPSEDYAKKHYVTRTANFFGPWAGDYFNKLNQLLIDKFQNNTQG